MTRRRGVPRPGRALATALLAALLLLDPTAADAQYFGQNKVRYDRFDFQIMESDRFHLYHYPEMGEAVDDFARMAERWYERLARTLEFEIRDPIPFILYADHPDFQQTNVLEGRIGEGTGGVTEGLRNRVIMPFGDTFADTDHVLGHELVHAFQFEMADTRAGGGLTALFRQPLWWIEGMAEYLSLGRRHPLTEMWLRDAVLRDELPESFQALSRDPQYFPYRWGHAFWSFVAGTWGDEAVTRLFRTSLSQGIAGSVRQVLDVEPDTLMARWNREIRRTLEDDVRGRTHPAELGDRLLDRRRTGGRQNLAPSVSPDGRYVAFLSERDLFTISLFLADAETGRVVRTVIRSEANPHYDALAFIHASAAWAPDGDRLAVVIFARGRNQVAVVDSESGRILERVDVEGAGSLSHVAWSPDGRHLAASGMSEGTSDLFLVDLEGGSTRRLTESRHSDLQPAWSPDGRTLAFATDRRIETDLDRLHFAQPGLALLDVETGAIRRIGGLPRGKQVNPAFSPDGRSLYFIGDPDGVSDIYRVELERGRLHRVTRGATGVSGITARSAALSVSPADGRLFFSVFHDGEYQIRTLEGAEALGEPVAVAHVQVENAGALPPRPAVHEGLVMRYLRDPGLGLPPEPPPTLRPYRPRLSLEQVMPITIGVGVDQFGAVGFGSVLFTFTDMLGDHWLGVAVAAEGELRDLSALALYRNRERRWNWGVGAGRQTSRFGFTQTYRDGPDIVYEQFIQRITQDQLFAEARYPFSRARRAEFAVGATRWGLEEWVDQFRVRGGRTVGHVRHDFEDIDPLHIGQASAALVSDNTSFGFTGPVRGTRWRLELGQTVGDLQYTTALADGRRYLLRLPFTLAMRGMHIGRYGGRAEAAGTRPFFLGQETLVRGYSLGSFRVEECTVPEDAAPGRRVLCPEFERLQGSRMGVGNLELRFPLLGVEEYGIFPTFLFPVDAGVFVDGGVAWTRDQSPDLRFERDTPDRIPVFSAGLTSRIALGGYLALEIYWAYPFQRPVRGAHFGFHLAPAW